MFVIIQVLIQTLKKSKSAHSTWRISSLLE